MMKYPHLVVSASCPPCKLLEHNQQVETQFSKLQRIDIEGKKYIVPGTASYPLTVILNFMRTHAFASFNEIIMCTLSHGSVLADP